MTQIVDTSAEYQLGFSEHDHQMTTINLYNLQSPKSNRIQWSTDYPNSTEDRESQQFRGRQAVILKHNIYSKKHLRRIDYGLSYPKKLTETYSSNTKKKI